jgi:hypothetical protein
MLLSLIPVFTPSFIPPSYSLIPYYLIPVPGAAYLPFVTDVVEEMKWRWKKRVVRAWGKPYC